MLVAPSDSLNGTRAFWRMIGADVPKFRDALTEIALAAKAAHTERAPDFVVTDSVRESLWTRIAAKGVRLDRARFDSASTVVTRLIGLEIARYSFGPDAEFRRRLADDRVVSAALDLTAGAGTEIDLLRRAGDRRAAKQEDLPKTS
jgi:hypothetical protein